MGGVRGAVLKTQAGRENADEVRLQWMQLTSQGFRAKPNARAIFCLLMLYEDRTAIVWNSPGVGISIIMFARIARLTL
jgi:hypothetical protein